VSRKYKFHNPDGIYFISTATVYWLDVFTRMSYKDIVIDSLKYCIQEKGLVVYAYVIMSNHIHLIIARNPDGDNLSDILRDFKKYTAMHLIKAIKTNQQESRREWMLWMMQRAGKKNGNNTNYQFWQQHNQPIELEGKWIDQKMDYIHENPVEAGWVAEAHDYYYSSARNYADMETPLKIVSIYDGAVI